MKKIFVILKKELKRYFTDRRMIFGLIMPGLLIFIIYNFMGEYINEIGASDSEFNIVIVNNPDEFTPFNTVEGWNINIIETDKSKDELIKEIEEQNLDLYIVYEENFYNKILNYDPSSSKKAPNVEMYYNSASSNSATIYQYYYSMLNTVEGQIANRFDINNGDDIYDLASEEAITVQILTSMLPFLLVMLLFSGCMTVCSESVAGEKERGTIATLLVTPTRRSHLALGKVLALSITSFVSATASFLGLIASLPKLMGSEVDMTLSGYNVGTYALIFTVLLSTVLLFTVILSLISTFAKSVKEASMYSTPGMIVVTLVGVTSMASTVAVADLWAYIIPVYNSINCIIGILSFSLNPTCLIITVVANVVYTLIGVFFLTKMFNSEKIMFQK